MQVWDRGPKRRCDVKTSAPSFVEDWEYRVKPPAKKFVRWLTDWVEYEE